MTIAATLLAILATVPSGTPQPYIAAVEQYTQRDIPHVTYVRHNRHNPSRTCWAGGAIAYVKWAGEGVVAPYGWKVYLCPLFKSLSKGEKLWVLAHETEHIFGRDHEECGLMWHFMEEKPC